MKKVLIIGHFEPFCRYGGGSPRLRGLAKYLPEFGWKPIILTPVLHQKPDFEVEIIETSYREIFYYQVITMWKKNANPEKNSLGKIRLLQSVREDRESLITRLIMYTAGSVSYPHVGRGWIPFAVESGSRIIEREKVDAIISVWPITAHIVAKRLKHNFKIPWIADFYHLWSQGYYYQYGPIRKVLDRRLEVETLRSADALTTISKFFVTILQELHKQKTIYSITHGFDPSWVNSTISTKPGFTITYTGNIYKGKNRPSKLFAALNELIIEGVLDKKDVEVLFYGAIQGWLQEEIDRYNLSDIVHQCGVVSHSGSLQKQRESQILLHLGWDDANIKGFYTSKIFEYLAARRPVLAVGGASAEVVRDLLCETKAGVYCLTIEEIKDALNHFYEEYKRKEIVSYNGDIEKVNNYSHREMARKFADVLDSLI